MFNVVAPVVLVAGDVKIGVNVVPVVTEISRVSLQPLLLVYTTAALPGVIPVTTPIFDTVKVLVLVDTQALLDAAVVVAVKVI